MARFSRLEMVKVRTSITAAYEQQDREKPQQNFGKRAVCHDARPRRQGFPNRNRLHECSNFDVLIVGGGIAGASLGAEIAGNGANRDHRGGIALRDAFDGPVGRLLARELWRPATWRC